MLLDLKPILVTPGASLPFETREDLSDLVFGSCRPASEPILASGKVRNTAGVLELTGELSTTLHGVCDRCAGEFTRAVQIPVHAVLVSEEELEQTEDEWVFGIHDGLRARHGQPASVQARLQGRLLPLRQKPQRRAVRLQKGTRFPFCCFTAVTG